ncbi:hypothetical protein [Pseudonocardia nigra]|uniref:hypothetical protein n=1 Tax=Pseudonocardia nigra TaxID=1921578 RepID=UPI001C5FFFD3|nr:hypothetical protein [Pseudonocardia nigra]
MPTTPRRDATAPLGQRFNLFAECVLVGLVVTLACLPLVTWVGGVAAGCRWLRRYLDGGRGGVRSFAADLRAVLPGTLGIALAGAGVLALVALDVAVATSGIPGGAPLAAVLGLLVVPLLLSQLRAAATWELGVPWWVQWRAALVRTVTDPVGSALLLAAVVLVVVAAWQLLPLVVPALGCLTMAALAVERRAAARA